MLLICWTQPEASLIGENGALSFHQPLAKNYQQPPLVTPQKISTLSKPTVRDVFL